jgi:hypothetical protein
VSRASLGLERGMQTSLLHMSEFPVASQQRGVSEKEALDNFYGLPLVTFYFETALILLIRNDNQQGVSRSNNKTNTKILEKKIVRA